MDLSEATNSDIIGELAKRSPLGVVVSMHVSDVRGSNSLVMHRGTLTACLGLLEVSKKAIFLDLDPKPYDSGT